MNIIEQLLLRRTIHDLMDDKEGDYARGLHTLMGMVGIEYPVYASRSGIRQTTIANISARGPSVFVPPPRRKVVKLRKGLSRRNLIALWNKLPTRLYWWASGDREVRVTAILDQNPTVKRCVLIYDEKGHETFVEPGELVQDIPTDRASVIVRT